MFIDVTSNSPHPVIEANGLSRHFGDRVAVHDVNLKLHRGDILGFLGPNGAGKSTTMRMLTGNLAPSSGSVHIAEPICWMIRWKQNTILVICLKFRHSTRN